MARRQSKQDCKAATKDCLWDYLGSKCFSLAKPPTFAPTTPAATDTVARSTPSLTTMLADTIPVTDSLTDDSTKASATKATTKQAAITAPSQIECKDTKPAKKCSNWQKKDYCNHASQFFTFMKLYVPHITPPLPFFKMMPNKVWL